MKTILLTITLFALTLTSCKKKDIEPSPVEAEQTIEHNYSHYIIGGSKTIVVHFGEDNSSVYFPLIGLNQVYVNGKLVSFTTRADTSGSVIFYSGVTTTKIYTGDTLDIKNNKLPARNRIYINAVLSLDESSSSSLNSRIIVL